VGADDVVNPYVSQRASSALFDASRLCRPMYRYVSGCFGAYNKKREKE
jgi:hypothetical protein